MLTCTRSACERHDTRPAPRSVLQPQQGLRIDASAQTAGQRWWRVLANGDVAVALYNKGGAPQPPIPGPPCTAWNHSTGGYWEACGGADGNVGQFSGLTAAQAQDACCSNPKCAGFSFAGGSGYYKGNQLCGFVASSGYEGYAKAGQIPTPNANALDITLNLTDVNLGIGSYSVYDIWSGTNLGTVSGSYTAKAVPYHGTAFLRLSRVA